jgi:serine/threonine protein kinase
MRVSDQAALAPGQSLGPYKINSLLGSGGMGEVYCAVDCRLGRQVAIKLLPPAYSADRNRLRRFEQEAQAASRLNHPNILAIYDIGTHDGVSYIVFELLTGQTLREQLLREALPFERAIDYALQIARGLAAAHDNGIVHRDLKPENLFVTKDGRVKILDFGLAKLKSRPEALDENVSTQIIATAPGVVVGSVGYMSPEQVRAEEVDHRSDIFAFGAILYEMLSGRRAFQGNSTVEVLHAILKEEFPEITQPTPKLPPSVVRIIQHCLEKNPEARFQSIADVAFDLETLAAPAAPETSAPEVTHSGRRWLAWMAVAAAFIALVAAAIIWRVKGSDDRWENPLANANIQRVTDFPGTETDAAISSDGKFIVFLSDRDGTVDIWLNYVGTGAFVNLTKGRIPQPDHEGVRSIGLTPDSRTIGFTADASHVWFRVSQIDPLAKETMSIWLTPTVGGAAPRPFLERAVHVAWSPDGERIVYHEMAPGDPIFVKNRDANQLKQIFIDKPDVHCHHQIWSPDGRYIYFVRGFLPNELDVWRVIADGGVPEWLTHHNSKVGYLAWLDKRTLIYSATAEDGSGFWLYALDVEQRIPQRVTFGVDQYLSVAAASGPDGLATRLVATVANPIEELWTIPVSGESGDESAVRRFQLPVTRAGAPRFGPQYVVFLSSKGGAESLWKTQGGEAVELWRGSEGGVIAPAAVSPDGQRICFSIRRQGRNELYVINSDGTNPRPLAPSLDVRDAPSWSPDGKFIAVAAAEAEGSRLYKVPVDGTAPVRLLDGISHQPLWSPDGRFILYAEPIEGAQYAIKAVTPEKQPYPLPELWLLRGNSYRFLPNGKQLVALIGRSSNQNFWLFDLQNGQRRQLTNLKSGDPIGIFDVSPDGRQILFDRVRQNSDIVLIDLSRK